MFAKRDSASTSAKKRELTAYNLFVKEQMPILCALEKNKGTSRKLPNELMVVIAKKWHLYKNRYASTTTPKCCIATQTEKSDFFSTVKMVSKKPYVSCCSHIPVFELSGESSSQTTMSFPQVMANTRGAWV